MKKYILRCFLLLFIAEISFAQTTATDFTTNDCDGVSHNLFSELDAGKVIVIAWVMPCVPCSTYTVPAYSAVQSFATSHPGRVHFYMADDETNTTCQNLTDWGVANNMPNTTFFSAYGSSLADTVNMSDYGSPGMPKVVVLGGSDHTVYYNENFSQPTFEGVQSAIINALSAPLNSDYLLGKSFESLVFPNPINNVLNVSYPNHKSTSIHFSIVDILGKVVFSIKENLSYSTLETIKSINVSSLSNGSYFLRISSEISVESVPFIVSH